MRQKIAHWVCCALLLISVPAAAQRRQAPAPERATVTLLQINDVYQIAPVDRGKRGGLARVATLQKEIRAQSPRTLFVLAGDFISPSVASRVFQGRQMVETLNAAGLDIATLGNHEFDFGPDVLKERMRESRFAYTVANVFDRQTGRLFGGTAPYILRDLNGVKVGIFGLLLPETAQLSSAGPNVRFTDPFIAGRRAARQLRRMGADIVVALTHLSMAEDKRLARLADVDLILGGHEHELLMSHAGRAPILKMGSDARNLGRIDLHLTRPRGARRFRLESMDWQVLPVDDTIKDEPETAVVVARFEAQLNQNLSEVIGQTDVQLEARAAFIRRGESNLGNLIADAYRQALDADTALVNSGSIRSDTTYGPGPITKKDVLSILPFENTLVKARVTGAHLKRLLENGVSLADQEAGRFPQASGMTFTYDVNRPVGSRVTAVTVGGQPLDEARQYTVVVSAYVLEGGDGYDFTGAEVVVPKENGPFEPVVIEEAIRKAGTISPRVEGRVKPAGSAARHGANAPQSFVYGPITGAFVKTAIAGVR